MAGAPEHAVSVKSKVQVTLTELKSKAINAT
jgi:hypothetical protein